MCGIAGLLWLRYAVTVVILRRREHLPLRLGRFLDWGCRAGIFRVAGGGYQFRHDDLRDWLHHRP